MVICIILLRFVSKRVSLVMNSSRYSFKAEVIIIIQWTTKNDWNIEKGLICNNVCSIGWQTIFVLRVTIVIARSCYLGIYLWTIYIKFHNGGGFTFTIINLSETNTYNYNL